MNVSSNAYNATKITSLQTNSSVSVSSSKNSISSTTTISKPAPAVVYTPSTTVNQVTYSKPALVTSNLVSTSQTQQTNSSLPINPDNAIGYGKKVPLPNGYTGRVDRGQGDQLPHGHVYDRKGNEVGEGNCLGGESHNDNFDKVPDKVVDAFKKSGEWKKGETDAKKQEQKKITKQEQEQEYERQINNSTTTPGGTVVPPILPIPIFGIG